MTIFEAKILLNQAEIINALSVLISEPLSNHLHESAQSTLKFVEKYGDMLVS
jgi:hypothetical protein